MARMMAWGESGEYAVDRRRAEDHRRDGEGQDQQRQQPADSPAPTPAWLTAWLRALAAAAESDGGATYLPCGALTARELAETAVPRRPVELGDERLAAEIGAIGVREHS